MPRAYSNYEEFKRVCFKCGQNQVYKNFDENGEYWKCENCGEETHA